LLGKSLVHIARCKRVLIKPATAQHPKSDILGVKDYIG